MNNELVKLRHSEICNKVEDYPEPPGPLGGITEVSVSCGDTDDGGDDS